MALEGKALGFWDIMLGKALVRSGWVLLTYLLGLVAMFVGERLLGEGKARWILDAAGLAAVLAVTLTWTLSWLRTEGGEHRVGRLRAVLAWGPIAAVGLYVIGSDLVLGPAAAKGSDTGLTFRQLLAVAWPVVLALTVVPLIFVQWSIRSMGRSSQVDAHRVTASATAGGISVVFLCTLFFLNAICNHKDANLDLSYFKTTSPSENTLQLVAGMDTDTQALLFFPPANDVLEEVRPFFEELAAHSPRLRLLVVDRALAPDLVKTHKVTRDGMVVLARGENRQTIDLGADLEQAKLKLRKLDSEVQTALLKLNRKQEAVYFTAGHGERSAESIEGDPRQRVSVLKNALAASNFVVKPLGMAQGLTKAVPDDAAMVLMIGPTEALIPGEAEALQAYLEGGGHLLLMLDPAAQVQPEPLLAYLGLKFNNTKLANDQAFVVASQTLADKYNIVTDVFSSHASVTMVSRYSHERPVAFPLSGSLEKIPDTKQRLDFIARSLPNTFADADGNMALSKDEKKGSFQLAAAMSLPVDKKPEAAKVEPPKPEKPGDKPADKNFSPAADKRPEMRAVVFADADAFGDVFLPFYGNRILVSDVIHWLAADVEAGGAPTTEEDVPVTHTRAQDVVWFYGTVFAVPILILGIGFATRFGRGRERRV